MYQLSCEKLHFFHVMLFIVYNFLAIAISRMIKSMCVFVDIDLRRQEKCNHDDSRKR